MKKTTKKKIKTFILDYSKWRCGGNYNSKNKLGEGGTALLNEKGYMCCLGQFSKQCGVEDSNLLGYGMPENTNIRIPFLCTGKKENIVNTSLAFNAMWINDRSITTPEEKIILLRKEFKKKNIKIRVINKPKKN